MTINANSYLDSSLMVHLFNAPHQFLMESAIFGVLVVMIKVLLEMAGGGDGDEGDDDALGQRPHQVLMESSWCTAIERLDCKQTHGQVPQPTSVSKKIRESD